MESRLLNFIKSNSPDGGFLQSVYWRKLQEAVGRKTYHISETGEEGEPIAHANIIEHKLSIAGKYFYVPRGPIFGNYELGIMNYENKIKDFTHELLSLAKKNNVGWVRIEPASEDSFEKIKSNLPKEIKIKKSAADMQPREILVLDIAKSEEEILAGMKQKTRYNVRLSQKKGVRITHNVERVTQEKIEDFLRLVKITSKRDQIKSHPENYYRKMFEIIPPEVLQLYIAEYEGKIIAANLVLFFGHTATYMHGASDNVHRDVMAPYLLQWQQIQDAKAAGCTRYDFGGVKTENIPNPKSQIPNPWSGITKFKTGFAPETEPIQFLGCYDIILNPIKYAMYRILQKIQKLFRQ